jgi:dephospho-CoA kinase
MIIIGITGTLGAGKGTIVDYLKDKHGFLHFSVREYLLGEIRKRGLPENRDSMYNLANELRALHGPSYITDLLFEKALLAGKDSVIESIRTPGEIESLKKKSSFYLLAVTADPGIRFRRIKLRKSETDDISFETFLENEKREMSTSDPNMQNLARCISLADHVLQNNGTKEMLIRRVDSILGKILRPTG